MGTSPLMPELRWGKDEGSKGLWKGLSEDTRAFLLFVFLALAPSSPVWMPVLLAEPLLGDMPLRPGKWGWKGVT